jgi:hypothetical protein
MSAGKNKPLAKTKEHYHKRDRADIARTGEVILHGRFDVGGHFPAFPHLFSYPMKALHFVVSVFAAAAVCDPVNLIGTLRTSEIASGYRDADVAFVEKKREPHGRIWVAGQSSALPGFFELKLATA